MPSPASCAVPRWPTIALSTMTKRGSATSAPKAGTASATISRSCRRRARSGVGGSLCHDHQSNLPQVRDAMRLGISYLRSRCARSPVRCSWRSWPDAESFSPAQPVDGETCRSAAVHREPRELVHRAVHRVRAQVLRSSPQHLGRRPHGLWITRLADGADGPTVVRRPLLRPSLGNVTKPTRRNRSWASYLSVPCRRKEGHGEVRSADGRRWPGEYFRALGRSVGRQRSQ